MCTWYFGAVIAWVREGLYKEKQTSPALSQRQTDRRNFGRPFTRRV